MERCLRVSLWQRPRRWSGACQGRNASALEEVPQLPSRPGVGAVKWTDTWGILSARGRGDKLTLYFAHTTRFEAVCVCTGTSGVYKL